LIAFSSVIKMSHKPLQSNFDVDYVISYRLPKDEGTAFGDYTVQSKY
jgi:hypothetical protein